MTAPVVQTFNEWDPLEEVIVGSVLGAVYPPFGPILAANGDPQWLLHYQGEFVEEELILAANEQIEAFIAILQEEGVTVRRPDPMPLNVEFASPYWRARSGWNIANPRDLFLVVGDQIIECASPLRFRHFEAQAYRRLMRHYFNHGARWFAAPPPSLREPLYDFSTMEPALGQEPPNREVLDEGEAHRYPITEHEPVFEAADFVRCGRDLFVIQSMVTNQAGINWVRRHLGEQFRVHEIETRCPNPMHIDTTFVPLAPGKALINPRWVKALPPCLDSWEIIVAPEPQYSDDSPMASPYFTSQWLSMNVFSLDHKRVFVDAQQTNLIKCFEQHGLEPIPVDFDAVGTFGGSFHCVTLDIRRRGELQDHTSLETGEF